MKKLKLKPIIIATATGVALTCSSVVSAGSFVNFMTDPEVDSNSLLAAKFGTILSFNKHMLCDALITSADEALNGKSFDINASNQGNYFASSTSEISSTGVTMGEKVTDFQIKWHKNIIDWTFDTDKMTTCASESTFICSAEEEGALDTKTPYASGDSSYVMSNGGVNEIRCVLKLGTGCNPSLADNGSMIIDLVDVTNDKPSSCSHSVSIPGLEVDTDNNGTIDDTDVAAAKGDADAVLTAISSLFASAGDSAAPVMVREHTVGSSRDIATQSLGTDRGYGY